MLGLPLIFTVPAILGALVLLPALYFLLRVTPPRPREMPFPPLRLILDQKPRDETPARTPPWLLLLRLTIAALIILAMAGPIWNPRSAPLNGNGPLALLIDDGFAAAPDWDTRVAASADRLAEAGRSGRPVALAGLSDGSRALEPITAAQAQDRLRAMKPLPVLPDRAEALPSVAGFAAAHPDLDLVWIADGLENGGARAFAEGLVKLGLAHPPTVLMPGTTPLALAGADNKPEALSVTVLRADGRAASGGTLRAFDAKGLPLGDAAFAFGGSPETGTRTQAVFALPVELRNDIARVAVTGEASAGAVTLLDGRWKRRRIDVVSGVSADIEQPLLSPSYFIAKALGPFADVRAIPAGLPDPILAALDDHPSVLVLADLGQVTGPAHDDLVHFVERGGVLLRFAGSRLAAAPTAGAMADDLEPVNLRRGGRTFGGALSWDKPKALAPFDRTSPFFGLADSRDVNVSRQVLAEPDAGLPGKTWAQLDDGTPLVTADKRGKGTIVLFHVTADTTWSNLPLSGLFVDMLRRIVALSATPASSTPDGSKTAGSSAAAEPAGSTAALPPTRILDGFGDLGAPPPAAKPVVVDFAGPASVDHPPGFYGAADAVLAVNALAPDATLAPADLSDLGLARQPLKASEPLDLRAALLCLAVLGLVADALGTLLLGGEFQPLRGRRAATAAALMAAMLLTPALPGGVGSHARAAEANSPAAAALAADRVSKRDMDAALRTRLAYVLTGDAAVDDASREGLKSLSRALANRTSLDPGEPMAIDPASDEMAFYPLLYWPVVATVPQPSSAVVGRVSAFMKNGGTVLFDTRDALTARPDSAPTGEALWLSRFLAGVDVPELETVPRDHVITKTFYLLDSFVGRYTTGQTWVEALPPAPPDGVARPARSGDSVSPIVITGNDLAAGWASDSDGDPLYPLVPGGTRQRELAIRGGINLVIYTLTGNYKADQVHVRDLLERLAH